MVKTMTSENRPSLLIVGINGFIGNHLSRLLKYQYEITGVASTPHPVIQTILADKYNWNPSICFEKEKFDFCINAGGSSSVGWSFDHQEEDYLLNVVNTEKLVAAITQFNPTCKLVQLSSAAVYGNPEHLPLDENHPLKPISPYGRHKMQSEQLISYSSVNSVSLRIFSAYGPGLQKQLFWDILQKAQKNNSIDLFGTGMETRDFIYIDDLVQAISIVMKKSTFDGSAINVASGISIPISVAASSLINSYNPSIMLRFNNIQKEGDPLHWEADIKKLKEFGFYAMHTIHDGLKTYANWFRNEIE
jgi:UDP-glucose 4-epimerase